MRGMFDWPLGELMFDELKLLVPKVPLAGRE